MEEEKKLTFKDFKYTEYLCWTYFYFNNNNEWETVGGKFLNSDLGKMMEKLKTCPEHIIKKVCVQNYFNEDSIHRFGKILNCNLDFVEFLQTQY